MLPGRWQIFSASVQEALSLFHTENPDLQGIGRERFRLTLQPRLPAASFTSALQRLARENQIVLDGAFVRLASHTVRLTSADEALWDDIGPLLGGSMRFRPPRVRDIADEMNKPEGDIRKVLKLVTRLGRVDEVAHDHFFLRSTVCEMVAITVEAAADETGGEFTAAQFRDRLGNGRKVAIQILEFFDRHGVTLRRGDLRRMNKHRLDLFGAFEPASDALVQANCFGRESSPVGRPDFKSGWGSEPVPGGFDSHSLPPASLK
jgi:selenocysteine-specific elongation factor